MEHDRGEKSQTKAYIRLAQVEKTLLGLELLYWTDLSSLLVPKFCSDTAKTEHHLVFKHSIKCVKTADHNVQGWKASSFVKVKEFSIFNVSFFYLCCGPKHSSLTSGGFSIPNLSEHIPHCLFDGQLELKREATYICSNLVSGKD